MFKPPFTETEAPQIYELSRMTPEDQNYDRDRTEEDMNEWILKLDALPEDERRELEEGTEEAKQDEAWLREKQALVRKWTSEVLEDAVSRYEAKKNYRPLNSSPKTDRKSHKYFKV